MDLSCSGLPLLPAVSLWGVGAEPAGRGRGLLGGGLPSCFLTQLRSSVRPAFSRHDLSGGDSTAP